MALDVALALVPLPTTKRRSVGTHAVALGFVSGTLYAPTAMASKVETVTPTPSALLYCPDVVLDDPSAMLYCPDVALDFPSAMLFVPDVALLTPAAKHPCPVGVFAYPIAIEPLAEAETTFESPKHADSVA